MIIRCNEAINPLPHMWSKCIGAGRACEGLRAHWQDQLRQAKQECGFEYIRFHGLLAEDMFVCHQIDGEIRYQWHYIDALYDFLLEIGVRPIVEFGFMPPRWPAERRPNSGGRAMSPRLKTSPSGET